MDRYSRFLRESSEKPVCTYVFRNTLVTIERSLRFAEEKESNELIRIEGINRSEKYIYMYMYIHSAMPSICAIYLEK